jgi:hypothetical protein
MKKTAFLLAEQKRKLCSGLNERHKLSDLDFGTVRLDEEFIGKDMKPKLIKF